MSGEFKGNNGRGRCRLRGEEIGLLWEIGRTQVATTTAQARAASGWPNPVRKRNRRLSEASTRPGKGRSSRRWPGSGFQALGRLQRGSAWSREAGRESGKVDRGWVLPDLVVVECSKGSVVRRRRSMP
ncbi:hypothetical protein Droror1_Dr00023572 [Drosera rotundifolia]